MDVLLWIGHLEKQQLRDDDVGHHVIDGCAQKDNAVHEQSGINIVAALTAPRLLDDHRYQKVVHNVFFNPRRNVTDAWGTVKPCRAETFCHDLIAPGAACATATWINSRQSLVGAISSTRRLQLRSPRLSWSCLCPVPVPRRGTAPSIRRRDHDPGHLLIPGYTWPSPG